MRIRLMRMTASVGLVLLALTACGGSGSDDGGVASLGDSGGSDAEAKDTEQEAQDWAECMRKEGIDIADPTVDEDGNLKWEPLRVGQGAGAIDREAFEQATQTCGTPPGREMSNQDQTEMQDAVLEMVQCLRDKGFDMPDPEFEGGGVRMGGEDLPFDPNDPDFQKAQQECQEKAFAGTSLEDRAQ